MQDVVEQHHTHIILAAEGIFLLLGSVEADSASRRKSRHVLPAFVHKARPLLDIARRIRFDWGSCRNDVGKLRVANGEVCGQKVLQRREGQPACMTCVARDLSRST